MLIKAAHRSRFTVIPMTGNIREVRRGGREHARRQREHSRERRWHHLFEEPGALDEVARLAREWFELHLLHAETHSAAPRTQQA
jgi:hypothetical protein